MSLRRNGWRASLSDFNNNQNHDKEQDGSTHIRYCAICHRSEQDAGRLVDMPGGLSICPSCMQHMVDAASSVDYQQFMDQISKGMMPDVSDLMSLLDGIPGQSRDNGTAPVNNPVSVNTYPTGGNPGPFVFPGLRKIQINPRLNPVYCFSNLVTGECNKMGITAGESISSAPGNTPFNPLFLFGAPGLGKTHLSQAIGIAIKEKYPDLVVLYVTGNEFKTQYMDAVNVKNKLTDFLAFYMKIDVLIVDDIQDLMGQGSQNAFFNVFNHLHENGKQLIFTSDRAPADLQNFEERLLSRLKWGLSVELQRPSYATRLEMLKARSFREGVTVSEDVLVYLATRIKSNFRELEGALISLIAHATLVHKEMTVELAEMITGKIIGEDKSEISIGKVQKTVCEYFNITKETLLSKSRKRQIVQARQIAMFMSRSLVGCSLSTIGAELGGKDHATVLHACNTVSDLMTTDKLFKQYVTDIEKMLVPAR